MATTPDAPVRDENQVSRMGAQLSACFRRFARALAAPMGVSSGSPFGTPAERRAGAVSLVLDGWRRESEPARAAIRARAAGSTTPLRLWKQQRSISAETLARSASARSRACATTGKSRSRSRDRVRAALCSKRDPIASRSRVDAPASPWASSSICCSLEPARRCFRSAGPRQERFGLRAVVARLVRSISEFEGRGASPTPG